MKKIWDFYALKPDAPIYQTEFGFYVLEKWKEDGYVPKNASEEDLASLFGYDPQERFFLGNLGSCEASFSPFFEEKQLKDEGEHEIVQDIYGREVKYFKNRRSGFMPEYLDGPVKDRKTWEENCAWRLNPKSPERVPIIQETIVKAQKAALEGKSIVANMVGGFMYLRSLTSPTNIMYLLYDDPELIDSCMQAWFLLADHITSEYQKAVTIDEIFLEEDICYNHGFLVSTDMIRKFLFPYYSQLITNIKARQSKRGKTLHFQLDTDGFSDVSIPLYREIGLDFLSPFEGASGCDVVRTAKEYPDLLISGGFDKRIMAKGKEAIDREVDRIMPFMKKRGGYIPTCDHGVPVEVSFENYMHYRKRMLEFAH